MKVESALYISYGADSKRDDKRRINSTAESMRTRHYPLKTYVDFIFLSGYYVYSLLTVPDTALLDHSGTVFREWWNFEFRSSSV
jgi:hypothetical protein